MSNEAMRAVVNVCASGITNERFHNDRLVDFAVRSRNRIPGKSRKTLSGFQFSRKLLSYLVVAESGVLAVTASPADHSLIARCRQRAYRRTKTPYGLTRMADSSRLSDAFVLPGFARLKTSQDASFRDLPVAATTSGSPTTTTRKSPRSKGKERSVSNLAAEQLGGEDDDMRSTPFPSPAKRESASIERSPSKKSPKRARKGYDDPSDSKYADYKGTPDWLGKDLDREKSRSEQTVCLCRC